MAIELSLFNNSVTTLVNHLTNFYPEEAELETYVLCARVKCPNIPGGSGLNWVTAPAATSSPRACCAGCWSPWRPRTATGRAPDRGRRKRDRSGLPRGYSPVVRRTGPSAALHPALQRVPGEGGAADAVGGLDYTFEGNEVAEVLVGFRAHHL